MNGLGQSKQEGCTNTVPAFLPAFPEAMFGFGGRAERGLEKGWCLTVKCIYSVQSSIRERVMFHCIAAFV